MQTHHKFDKNDNRPVRIITVENGLCFKLHSLVLNVELIPKVRMRLLKIIIFISIFTIGLSLLLPSTVKAERLECADLFPSPYKAEGFIIQLLGKKQSKNYLNLAHENLLSSFELSDLIVILSKIKNEGTNNLTAEDKDFIIKFRQNTSFLRSVFQFSDERHESPTLYGNFVRDFGILKDYILLNDNDGAQHTAKEILRKYSDLDFENLMDDAKPASKKSLKNYFSDILKDTHQIMNKKTVTVEEIHDVRKNLRDILRYMQISNEMESDSPQIEFLKKTNEKLGEISDENSARILQGEITDETVLKIPEKIRARVEYFLENYELRTEE